MNDNQKVFTAFFILIVAALNTQSSPFTGQATKEVQPLGQGVPGGYLSLPRAALTYCAGKGDVNGDGLFDKEDIILAEQHFARNIGDELRKKKNYIAALDVFPVRKGKCGDGALTYSDMTTLSEMLSSLADEQRGMGGQRITMECVNECRHGQMSLAPTGYRICVDDSDGSYDGDTCRDWKIVKCPAGYEAKQTRKSVRCVNSYSSEGKGVIEQEVSGK